MHSWNKLLADFLHWLLNCGMRDNVVPGNKYKPLEITVPTKIAHKNQYHILVK